jgi:hypothetical protein
MSNQWVLAILNILGSEAVLMLMGTVCWVIYMV